MPSYQSLKIKKPIKKVRHTLQVRPADEKNDERACLKASLTVEAALVLPLILFSMILLMMPLHMMNVERRIQAVCEEIAGDLSKYMYTINELRRGNKTRDGTGASGYEGITDGAALGAYAAMKIASQIDDSRLNIVNVLNSSVGTGDDMVTVKIDYAYRLPFKVFDLGFLQQEVTASRRAWVGAKGGVGETENTGESDDEWVYIGKNATRYHLSATCHYLSNDWSRATVGSDGKAAGKGPCERCAAGAKPGQSVYITPNGDRYHTDTGCSAMRSYPQMVRLSEVEHLGCCSYCASHFAR